MPLVAFFKSEDFRSPALVAFVASLLLSAVAVLGTVTVPRDATLYFDTAQAFIDGGMAEALSLFDWPWFSILLAMTHRVIGLSFEDAGYLWCALFMAGTCALLVDQCCRWTPGSGRLACLVVLSIPGFNQYRSDILREFGFWFFCVMTLWLVGRWRERPHWLYALMAHLTILLAAAFRLEAVFLFPVLVVWSLAGQSCLRVKHFVLPVVLMSFLALAFLSLSEIHSARWMYYQHLLTPQRLLEMFSQLSEHLADGMRFKYSRDDAWLILFLGMFGVLLLGIAASLGPLALPVFSSGKQAWREIGLAKGQHFTWAVIIYFLMLLVFFMHNQFMIARYESLLSVLLAPLAVHALRVFIAWLPRLGRLLLGVIVIVMLDNVISLGAKKTHFVEAGRWMAINVEAGKPVYYDDVRISYYAGRGARRQPFSRNAAMSAEHIDEYCYFFIEADPNESWLKAWLQNNGKQVLAKFANSNGDTVLVLGP